MTVAAVPVYRAVSIRPSSFPPFAWNPNVHALMQSPMRVEVQRGALPDHVRFRDRFGMLDLSLPVSAVQVAGTRQYDLTTPNVLLPGIPAGDVLINCGHLQTAAESQRIQGRIT